MTVAQRSNNNLFEFFFEFGALAVLIPIEFNL